VGYIEALMDIETDRQDRLTQARERLHLTDGETIEGRFGPSSFGYHELLDRAYLMQSNWETFIAEHPATLLDPERYRQAQEIAVAIAEFYQLVGRDDRD
jgi:hypothetical protein